MTITLTREEAQQVEQYIKPGAMVPVDMQTTRLLVNALRARLAQPEPEPAKLLLIPALMEQAGWVRKREWQGLTDEERYLGDARSEEELEYAKAIEAKLKEKNA
jgi:hypothetical protein